MRNLIAIASVMVFFTSCGKLGENDFLKKEKKCATVSEDALPTALRDNFSLKYPEASSVTWYDRDGKSFVALFTVGGIKSRASFDRVGSFESEMNENHNGCNHEGDDDHGNDHHKKHHRKPPPKRGCECGDESEIR